MSEEPQLEKGNVMFVNEVAARKLFVALGKEEAGEWSRKRLLLKLNNLPSEVGEATPTEKDDKVLFRAICKALENDDKIEYEAENNSEEEKVKEEKPGKGKKGKKETEESKEDKPPKKERKPREGMKILGRPFARVVNWMGRNGWTYPEVRKAINSMGFEEVKDSYARTAWTDGKNPKYSKEGELGLTDKEIKQLNAAKK